MKKRVGLLALVLCLVLTGTALAAPAGSTVWGYSEGLAQCELNGKWGYVNGKRDVVIPLQYDSIVSFSLGVAAVNLNGKLGVIRQDGAYLIRPEYDTLMPIDCGLYIAQKGGGWGVVSILPFSDGAGGTTNVLYDLTYDSVKVEEQGGVQVLTLRDGNGVTRVPLFDLPGILVRKGVPSARFPLTRGKLPKFSDVSQKEWYALWVDIAYNVGLVSGVGDNRFNPNGTMSVAEALQLAATIESRYRDDSFHKGLGQTKPYWYTGAVNYCIASGIIRSGQFTQKDYTRPATRLEMARIFAATSPVKNMPALNNAVRVRSSIPDILPGSAGSEAVYALYEKGLLSGVDGNLTFNSRGTMTRAEAAALASRIARAEQRITLWGSFDSSALVD